MDTSEQLEVDRARTRLDELRPRPRKIWLLCCPRRRNKVAQYHDELLRAKAEVENIRRRAQEDVAKARKFGTESFAESLVPVQRQP